MRVFHELSPEEQESIEYQSRELKIMVREFRRGHIHRNETKTSLIQRLNLMKTLIDNIEKNLSQ